MPTPVTGELGIDHDRLIKYCRYLLNDGGCDGINLLGTTGEATSFSVGQRSEAMRAVAGSGLPLGQFMVGTGAAALADACRLTSEARSLGFGGALLLPPFYYKGIDADALVAFVDTLIRVVGREDLRLYLYNFPANSGVAYSIDVVTRLREGFPEVVKGLKDSSGDLEYSAALARQLPGFDVFPSDETALARAREFGFAGCVSATANVTGPILRLAMAAGPGNEQSRRIADAGLIRSTIASFPLVAAVKDTVALLTGDETWREMVPPLARLSASRSRELRDRLATTPLSAESLQGAAAAVIG